MSTKMAARLAHDALERSDMELRAIMEKAHKQTPDKKGEATI